MAQYIDKSAIVAEIEKLKERYSTCPTRNNYEDGLKVGRLTGYKDALHKINTLEVKEVNLEEEITSQIRLLNGVHTLDNGKQWWKGTYNELSYFAKYFFELGLKVQKGE